MKTTQKTFTIQLHTTDTNIDKGAIEKFLNNSIANSQYADDMTCEVNDDEKVLYNFLNDNMAFSFFIRKTKEEFLEEYPYFADEYDFCLSEFNKNPKDALLTFLENTSTDELTEPYGLTPPDFSFAVGIYINNHFNREEKIDFLKTIISKGLKVDIY